MNFGGIPFGRRQALYLATDGALAVVAVAVGHWLRFGLEQPSPVWRAVLEHPSAAALFVAVHLVVLYLAGAYEASVDWRRPYHLFRLASAVLVAFLVQSAAVYLLRGTEWGPLLAGLSSLAFLGLVAAQRVLVCQLRPWPPPGLGTLILGANSAGLDMAEAIRTHPDRDRALELRGFLHDGPVEVALPEGCVVLGGLDGLAALVAVHRVRLVIVAVRDHVTDATTEALLGLKARGVLVEDMPTTYMRITGKVPIRHLTGSWWIFGPELSGTRQPILALQRLADIVLGAVGLALAGPLIAVAAVAVRLDSPGPAFYVQERVGLDERPFPMVKLRTMRQDAEAGSGAVWSQGAADPRVTRVGRFLRRTRIDELPQFWNVLRGDMSIVGPRPERDRFVRELKEVIPFYGMRHAVKPGLTGWAQVKYRYGASVQDAEEKLAYDLYAIRELTPAMYLLILLKTVQTVLFKPGS